MLNSELDQTWSDLTQNSAAGATGLCWPPNWGLLAFTGPDAQSFLQGYFTAEVDRLSPNTLLPTALCSLQGRVVANGWAYLSTAPNTDDPTVYWLIHRSLTDTVMQFLHKYLAFAKAEVSDVSQEWRVLVNLLPPNQAPAQFHIAPNLEVQILTPTDALNVWQQTDHKASAAQVQVALMKQGLVLVDADSTEQFLPQMLNLTESGAVDFAKGCYLGQEVVARAQHRGSVKRELLLLSTKAAQPPAPDNNLRDAAGKTVGQVVQWTQVEEQYWIQAVVRRTGTSSTGQHGTDAQATSLSWGELALSPIVA